MDHLANAFAALLALALFCSAAEGVFVTVDAVAEVCFHDDVKTHTKMGLTFEVSEGGFLDIDVKVRSVAARSKRPSLVAQSN